MTKTVLYMRVSSQDQIAEHQLTQAQQAGFTIDEVIVDQGVSGVAVTLKDRPQGRRLFDILRAGDTLLVRWVDRLGRNYSDVTENIREFMRRGVIVRTVINGMVFDGSTKEPMAMAVRDALIGFMAAMAQAQAEATKEAQLAGIAHKRAKGEPKAYRGRKPSYTRAELKTVIDMLAANSGASEIAKATGLTRQTVLRIRADQAGADEVLKAWGM